MLVVSCAGLLQDCNSVVGLSELPTGLSLLFLTIPKCSDVVLIAFAMTQLVSGHSSHRTSADPSVIDALRLVGHIAFARVGYVNVIGVVGMQ